MNKNLSLIIGKLDKKFGVWLFYTALVLFILSYSWIWPINTPFNYYYVTKKIMLVAQILCFIRIGLLYWKNPRYLLICTVIILLFYFSSRLSHGKEILAILNTAMVISASKDVNIKTILRVYLALYLIILFIVPITYVMGWSADIVKHKYELVGHSWGFFNPNLYAFLMQMLFFMVIIYLHVKKTMIIWAISWITAALIGWMTLSLTTVIILLFFPLLYYYFKYHSVPAIWLALSPLLLTLLSIGLSIYFGSSTGNTTFESRFSIPNLIYEKYGLSWLGQDCGIVSWWSAIRKGHEALYMNNLFLNLIIRYGVIIALITFVLYGHYLYRMVRMNNPIILAMVICLVVSGLMQMYSLYLALNFLLLYYFQEPYKRNMFPHLH